MAFCSATLRGLERRCAAMRCVLLTSPSCARRRAGQTLRCACRVGGCCTHNNIASIRRAHDPPKTQCTTRGPRSSTLLYPRRSEPTPPAPRPRQRQSGAEHAGPLKLSSERNRWLAMLSPAQETRRPCSPLAAAAARAFPCCCGIFARSGAPDQSKGAAFDTRGGGRGVSEVARSGRKHCQRDHAGMPHRRLAGSNRCCASVAGIAWYFVQSIRFCCTKSWQDLGSCCWHQMQPVSVYVGSIRFCQWQGGC